MIKINEWLLIRQYYAEFQSISKVAKLTGHDRKTVRKVVRSPYPFTYTRRKNSS